MRVLQLIDSLDPGGAERMAVNLANALATRVERSFLCATRKEGLLKASILPQVGYLFLNKRQTIDFLATQRLNRFVKKQHIQVVHAHSTSFFLATLLKFLNPTLVIVWHDHYGNSEFLADRDVGVLKWCSKYFAHTFSVNRLLEDWARQHLKLQKVSYLPNFAVPQSALGSTQLQGVNGKRIVCLANLRPQKDHFTLLRAFKKIQEEHEGWTLHCVGKDFNDEYSKSVKQYVKELGLENWVYLYGSRPDVFHILSLCNIGVLSSNSEGLPLALLEYGMAKLAVVATKVGECPSLISNNINGLLVSANASEELAKALHLYIENQELQHTFAQRFSEHIENNYSEKAQIETVLTVYNNYIAHQ